MSDCVSQRSKLCVGYGNEIWQGMCSNCADEHSRTAKIRLADAIQQARREDYEERAEFFREHDNTGENN